MNEVDYSSQLFFLSEECETKLERINTKLAKCVRNAQAISDTQIMVLEGKRSESMHEYLFEKGAAQNPTGSAHLYGYAVDLVPVLKGRISLEAEAFDDIAECMKISAQELGIRLLWGGAPHFDNFQDFVGFLEDLTNQYIDRRRDRGHRPQVELHHFEMGGEE